MTKLKTKALLEMYAHLIYLNISAASQYEGSGRVDASYAAIPSTIK